MKLCESCIYYCEYFVVLKRNTIIIDVKLDGENKHTDKKEIKSSKVYSFILSPYLRKSKK